MKKRVVLLMSLLICALLSCGKKKEAIKETETLKVESSIKATETEKIIEKKYVARTKEKDDKTTYDVVEFGKYDTDIGRAGAIEWLLVDKSDKSYLLVSRYIIDCKDYNEENTEVTWEKSTLNDWLNDNFFDAAFTSEEQEYMNSAKEFGLRGDGKVTLLDIDACKKYFGFDDENKRNYRLSAEATSWAISNWEEVVDSKGSKYNRCGSYYLTDSGVTNDKAAWVGQYGHVYSEGQAVKLSKGDGVRPVIVVKKEALDSDRTIVRQEFKEVETKANAENEAETNVVDETQKEVKNDSAKRNEYSNTIKTKYQSTLAPINGDGVIDLGGWEYGKTPIKWIYVAPNTQIICNNSPNRSENFGYKAKASSGDKGCYIPIFSRGECYGQDWEGRFYSIEDYKKIDPTEMKFDNKFEELTYGEHNIKKLLSEKYDLEEVGDGLVKVNGIYINVIYVSELDEILSK